MDERTVHGIERMMIDKEWVRSDEPSLYPGYWRYQLTLEGDGHDIAITVFPKHNHEVNFRGGFKLFDVRADRRPDWPGNSRCENGFVINKLFDEVA